MVESHADYRCPTGPWYDKGMQSIIFFTACNGNAYELTVEHDEIASIPISVVESPEGTIREVESERSWAGLQDLTHSLKAEIKHWASEVGD